ncbi:hypothetical protein AKJ61_03575, partial [candidate division MSBL1 archaeon SCGC-AAA259B11]
WFDTRDAHRGTVVDTRESGTYDYRYEWKTNEENTYSDWFDTRDGHPGTVVDENLVDTDYRLSWTENLSQAFSLSEEGSAKQLRSQVNGTLTTGQAYVGDYDYGVIWEGPALVEKVQENVYSATYTRGDWKTKTTTVTVTAKNNYSDDVYLSLASDPGVASSLGDHSLSLSSSARTGLTMEPIGTASTHSVTVTATDSKGKGKETISYTLNLTEEDKPSGTWTETSGTKEKNLKASTSLLVWALEPVHTEIVGRWGYEEFPTTITVNGEVWTEDGRENRNPGPGSYRVKFGSVDGLVAPGSREVFLHPGENKSVVGRYELKDMTFYDLRINLDPSEGGSTDPKGDYTRVYEDGTAVDITATSEEGWEFASWSGDASGTNRMTTVSMLSDREVTAHFDPVLKIEKKGVGRVELVRPDGSVVFDAAGGSYALDYGDQVKLEAHPQHLWNREHFSPKFFYSSLSEQNWDFGNWSDDASGSTKTITMTMDSPKSVTAHFVKKPELTVEKKDPGSVDLTTPDGTVISVAAGDTYTFSRGSIVTLTAKPDEGVSFEGWTDPASDWTKKINPLTVKMESDMTRVAHFGIGIDVTKIEMKLWITNDLALDKLTEFDNRNMDDRNEGNVYRESKGKLHVVDALDVGSDLVSLKQIDNTNLIELVDLPENVSNDSYTFNPFPIVPMSFKEEYLHYQNTGEYKPKTGVIVVKVSASGVENTVTIPVTIFWRIVGDPEFPGLWGAGE